MLGAKPATEPIAKASGQPGKSGTRRRVTTATPARSRTSSHPRWAVLKAAQTRRPQEAIPVWAGGRAPSIGVGHFRAAATHKGRQARRVARSACRRPWQSGALPVQERAVPAWLDGLPPRQGVEIRRLVLLDAVPANGGESWFLGRAFRLLRALLPEVCGVLSYCAIRSDGATRPGVLSNGATSARHTVLSMAATPAVPRRAPWS